MNLFLIGWSSRGGVDALSSETHLRRVVAQLPPPRPARVEWWTAPSGRVAMACAVHEPNRVGGIRYVHLERDRLALFSGRPFRWTGDEEAEGRKPLDPRSYLAPAADWIDELDGRWVAAGYDDRVGVLRLYSDALGAYPLFWGVHGGTRWISNNAQLVRGMLGTQDLELSAVAGLVASGWSLGGEPMWAGVHRFPRGGVVALRPGRPDIDTRQLPLGEIAGMWGAGFDPGRTSRLLVAAVAALTDWPGRPVVLHLSGGRDSRLLFAASVEGGIEVEVVSVGEPNLPDVRLARRICAMVGVKHQLRPADADDAMEAGLLDTSRFLGLTGSGAISLEDAAGYFTAADGAMRLLLNGQGGEIARVYYGSGDLLGRDGLVRALFDRVATSSDLLTPAGVQLVERNIGHAVDTAFASGVSERDIPDAFYLEHRMAGWAATGHGCVEYAKGDGICPLWSRRLLPQQLGASIEDRTQERFPQATLGALSPRLASIPYAEWTPQRRGSARIAIVHDHVRKALAAQPSLPAWEVLDRPAVERLLASDPKSLDHHGQRRVWRLATACMALHPA